MHDIGSNIGHLVMRTRAGVCDGDGVPFPQVAELQCDPLTDGGVGPANSYGPLAQAP